MHRLILFFILLTAVLNGEDVILYKCVKSRGERMPLFGERADYSSMGEELGKIDTGKESLRSIYKARLKDSWKGEPFYGPVERYVFKDSKGKLYIAHFEFQEGHNVMGKGIRFAIIPLTKVYGLKNKYVGSPYDGASIFDEGILKQLRTIARQKPSKGE